MIRSTLSLLISLVIHGVLFVAIYFALQQPAQIRREGGQSLNMAWIAPKLIQDNAVTTLKTKTQHKCAPIVGFDEVVIDNPVPDCPPEVQPKPEAKPVPKPQPAPPVVSEPPKEPEPKVKPILEQPKPEIKIVRKPEPKPAAKPKPVQKVKPKPKRQEKPRIKPKPSPVESAPAQNTSNNAFFNISYAGVSQTSRLVRNGIGSNTMSSHTLSTAKGRNNQPGNSNGSGNNNANAMNTYKHGLYNAIDRNKRYPRRAERMGIRGISALSFTVNADGSFSGIQLISSSGNSSLDQAALNAVSRTGRYRPTPDGQPIIIKFKIRFQ